MPLPQHARVMKKATRLAKYYTLTPGAERRLADIALWTIENFGLGQADVYITSLIDRCDAIVTGDAHLRTPASFSESFPKTQILLAKAESHFVVFAELGDEYVIFDFLHERSDLPHQLNELIEKFA